MFGCTTLVGPDFTGLNSLQIVGNYWMFKCTTLVNPDYSGLISLEYVGRNSSPFVNQLGLPKIFN